MNTGGRKVLLWSTVKHFASRMNMLTMFGDDIGMNLLVISAPVANV